MEDTIRKSSSESSVLSREEVLKTALEESTQVILIVVRQFGQDSKQHMIVERFIDLIKREYEFLVALREFQELCSQNHMQFGIASIQEITDMEKGKVLIKEQLSKMGLN